MAIVYGTNIENGKVPSLDLRFSERKSLVDTISGRNLVTFSRSSVGTYFDSTGTLRTAAANEARFDHNPATGESLGLLVEEARTNLVTYSEHFNDATWIKTYPPVEANAFTAPDGTFTADRVIPESNSVYVSKGVTLTAATYTASIYARANAATSFTLYLATSGLGLGASCAFNLSNGTAGSITHYGSSTGFTSSIQALSGGWYRCSITGLCTAATWFHQVGIFNNQNNSMYFWGAQLEAGSFPTSYIPTPATFTSRASSATFYDANGVIQTASTNVARSAAFFPDSNGVMRPAGLLLEAAGTNLLLRSQEIDNTTVWAGSYKLNYSANATTAPDGTTTADKVIPNTENVTHSTFQDPAGTLSGTYTFSLYAKASGYNKIVLFIDGASAGGSFGSGSAVFDLSTKAITNVNGSATIETLPNGWYRCSVTGTSASAVTVSTGFAIYDNSGNSTFAGNGTDGIFVWGTQLEASPYPTSYIATTASTVTRSADVSSSATVTRSVDVAQIGPGTNFSSWYNQSQGSLYVASIVSNASPNPVLAAFRTVVDQSDDYILTLVLSTGATRFASNNANINQWLLNASDTSTLIKRTAHAWAANNIAGSVNGSTVLTDSVASISPILDRMYLGRLYGTTQQLTGTISRLTYYPVRLSDNTLQTITR